jgi:pyridoxal phosphate enzyme (YggS family)
MGTIAENLKMVRGRIDAAAKRAGRDPSSIQLVAVSKTKTAEEIIEAYKAGQRRFGENYAQELREKHEHLTTGPGSRVPGPDIEWHFIGHLQKNKAKIVAPIASWIESIDSMELAEALDKRAGRQINCLIEVNLGGEESKTGIEPDRVESLARGMNDFKNLSLKGLMIIPPFSPAPEDSRPYFVKLRELLAYLNEKKTSREPLTELSMGMSHDFEAAIEEGATIVRVGTAIFGERN